MLWLQVFSVTMVERGDCCAARTSDISVRVGFRTMQRETWQFGSAEFTDNPLCGTFAGPGALGGQSVVTCTSRYVLLQNTGCLKNLMKIFQPHSMEDLWLYRGCLMEILWVGMANWMSSPGRKLLWTQSRGMRVATMWSWSRLPLMISLIASQTLCHNVPGPIRMLLEEGKNVVQVSW